MRQDHPGFEKGACTRCGLGPFDEPRCPPGFWMTPIEAKRWDAADPLERIVLERQWCCDHGISFDEKVARAMLDAAPADEGYEGFIMGSPAHIEIKRRWPRGWFTEDKPCICGFVGIAYASEAHYLMGDW